MLPGAPVGRLIRIFYLISMIKFPNYTGPSQDVITAATVGSRSTRIADVACYLSSGHPSTGMSPPIRRRMASGGLENHIWYIVTSHMTAKHVAISAPAKKTTHANGW